MDNKHDEDHGEVYTQVYTQVRYLSTGTAGRTFTAEQRNKITTPHPIRLHDARKLRNDGAQLRNSGFCLIPFRSKMWDVLQTVENPAYYREGDVKESAESARIKRDYFEECKHMIADITGADVVHTLSYAVRNATGSKKSKGVEYLTAYATFAHCDYTSEILKHTWKMMVKRGVPEIEAKRMRYAFYNVWQPTSHPVETWPLALLDWESAAVEDAHSVVLGYDVTPKTTSDGHSAPAAPPIAQLRSNANHRWYFYPNMQVDEAILFTQVDGRPGFAQHCFHTAVKHQTSSDPRPRQSIEVRFICGFLPSNHAFSGTGTGLNPCL